MRQTSFLRKIQNYAGKKIVLLYGFQILNLAGGSGFSFQVQILNLEVVVFPSKLNLEVVVFPPSSKIELGGSRFSFQVQNFELGGVGFSFQAQDFEFGGSGFSFEFLKYYLNLTIFFV